MQILNTSRLTAGQYNDIKQLINLCREKEAIDGVCFFEEEMNEYPDFPCFFLLYEEKTLVSFLSVFIPGKEECELYAYTHPSYRQKGYFKQLLQKAEEELKTYEISTLFFICEPGSISAKNTADSIGAEYSSSEYILKYDCSKIPEPETMLTLQKKNCGQVSLYETRLKRKIIGTCKVDLTDSCLSIYDFEITELKRGQGYGTQTLLLILKELLKTGYKTILLHVSSTNTPACRLYLKNGFFIAKQLDYHCCQCSR